MTDEPNAETAPKKRPGRPKGVPNKPKADAAPKGPTVAAAPSEKPRLNKEPLSDEQEHALTDHHVQNYQKALEAKKTADAKFKNACKLAKAEGVPLKQIKEYISYQTEEGQQQLREDLARKAKVARWAGLPIGAQVNFLEEIDRTPIDERTKEDGKRAGLRGEKAEVPRHVPSNLVSVWMEGWHQGQVILAGRIKQKHDEQTAEDAKAFDGELPNDEQAEEAVH